MPEKEIISNLRISELTFGILYAIASIAGALGGCAAGAHYYATARTAKLAFVLAYMILGAIFGIIFFASVSVFSFFVLHSVHELILYSLVAGSAGSVMLFSANWTVKTIFKRLGVEVEVTLRKGNEERRRHDDSDTDQEQS